MPLSQVFNRLLVRSKRKLLDLSGAGMFLYRPPQGAAFTPMHTKEPLFSGLPRLLSDALDPAFRDDITNAGRALREHRFLYVGEVAQYDDSFEWNDVRRKRLWRLNLHYFDAAPLWLLDAILHQNEGTLAQWEWLATSWIKQNPIGRFEAWNPYCLSRRIPNWILTHQLADIGGVAEDRFATGFLCSLYQQASYLYSNVEWDLPMNHLTANGRALLYAGVFFQGREPNKWLERGKQMP
jgi:hypothetical protein